MMHIGKPFSHYGSYMPSAHGSELLVEEPHGSAGASVNGNQGQRAGLLEPAMAKLQDKQRRNQSKVTESSKGNQKKERKGADQTSIKCESLRSANKSSKAQRQ